LCPPRPYARRASCPPRLKPAAVGGRNAQETAARPVSGAGAAVAVGSATGDGG
jgi:hypothetical protein